MEMLKAMRKCMPGGYVARKAYPNRKYYKGQDGTFMEAARVDHIDFISTDWENHPAECRIAEPLIHPKRNGQDRKGDNGLARKRGS
jgi:hypothetical protein